MDEIQQIKERNKQQQQAQFQIQQPQNDRSSIPLQSSIMIPPPQQLQGQQQRQSQIIQQQRPQQQGQLRADYINNNNASQIQNNPQYMNSSIVQSQFPMQNSQIPFNQYNQFAGQQIPQGYQSNIPYPYPPPPQQPYPYPPYQPQQGPYQNSQVFTSQQRQIRQEHVVLLVNTIDQSPQCRYCGSRTQRYLSFEIGERVWCWVCILLLVFWPIFYLPFFMDSCKDAVTRCSSCRKRLN